MSFEIKAATRVGVKPFVVFFGLSSGGKTHSALLFARGMVGPKGRIVVADTENGRANILADVIPGGFKHLDFQPPFTPARYIEAMAAAEKEADILILDSASHEWFGVQEMHEDAIDRMTRGATDWQQRERMNWPAWREPKIEHKKFIQAVLRFPTPVIFCLRAKTETKMVKGENGKNTIATGDHPIPDFDSKFIFESTLGIECFQADGKAGLARPMKWSRNELLDCLPKGAQQIGIEHGAALAAWCAAPGGAKAAESNPIPPRPAATVAQATEEQRAKLVKALVNQEQLAVEYFQKIGQLLPTETLPDLALRFVPATKKQFDALIASLTDFGNGSEAKPAFAPNGTV